MSVSCNEFIAATRRLYPAREELWLDFGEVYLHVLFNSRQLRDHLAQYFSEFSCRRPRGAGKFILVTVHDSQPPRLEAGFTVKQPDAGKHKIKEEYLDCPDGRIVRKRLTGLVLAFNASDNIVAGPALLNDNQVVNFINNRIIQYYLNKGCYLGHAAAISHAGRGLALAGFSGMGKSTLALRLMNRGCSFVSNDRLLLSAERVIYGVPKQPRINPGTALNNDALASILSEADRAAFAALPPEELWGLEHKYDALIDKCYGAGRFVLQAAFAGSVILNWHHEGKDTMVSQVSPEQRPDLVKAFTKEAGLFFFSDPEVEYHDPPLENYAARLAAAPMLEISGRIDMARAEDLCMRFLSGLSRE
jgi:HprK-related kinase B